MNKNNKGFTLIELLVVISIIGLLSSILFVALASARPKARDSERRLETASLRTALESYYLDHGGYPQATDWIYIEEDDDNNGPFSQALEEYITSTPRDPLYGETSDGGELYSYQYMSSEDVQYWAIKTVYETLGLGGSEEVITVYSSPEGEDVLGGEDGGEGSSDPADLALALDNYDQLTSYGITTGGDIPWEVSTEEFCVGETSAKTGCIISGQVSYAEFQLDVTSRIRFYFTANDGNPNDRLLIKQNGATRMTISPSGTCSNYSYGSLSGGTTIRMEYVNNSGTPGCIWIDYVRFEPY